MLKRNIIDEVAKKILGEDLLRVWQKVDEVAQEMQRVDVVPVQGELEWLPDPWKA
jgi:membrane dipeptidase